mgnify:CR=1 FL=1
MQTEQRACGHLIGNQANRGGPAMLSRVASFVGSWLGGYVDDGSVSTSSRPPKRKRRRSPSPPAPTSTSGQASAAPPVQVKRPRTREFAAPPHRTAGDESFQSSGGSPSIDVVYKRQRDAVKYLRRRNHAVARQLDGAARRGNFASPEFPASPSMPLYSSPRTLDASSFANSPHPMLARMSPVPPRTFHEPVRLDP